MLRTRFVVGIVSIGLTVPVVGVVSGQAYPNKPVRLVTTGSGGGGDFAARLIVPGLSASLGQPVIVENRTAIQAAEAVSKALPDGYTLLVSSTSFLIGALFTKTSYDPVRDFAPITLVEGSPNVLVVHPSLPVKSVKELIALAKAKPGELNYGASAVGAGDHLAAELFKSMAGVDIVSITYRGGSGAAITALLGGENQLRFASGPSVMSHVKSGRLRALAVTSAQPSALFPGLPTVASGLPGYEAVGMTAIFAPAKTPEAIIKLLNQEIVRVLKTPETKEKFFNAGIEIAGSSTEQLAAMVKAEIAKWGKVIQDAGIKAN